MSRAKQRVITGGVLILAGAAMALGIIYQGDRTLDEPLAASGAATSTSLEPSSDVLGAGGTAPPSTTVTNPIEGFLPRSGEASACREPVGVDLVDGYAATLTINGTLIAPEQMNVNLDADGNPTEVITASRSLGQYTYGPEEDCPNGEVLRPTGNVIQACVYRLDDGPGSCQVTEWTFDVL